MLYESIDQLSLPVPDLAAATAPFRRLGLTIWPDSANAAWGTRGAGCVIGDEANRLVVNIVSVEDRDAALKARGSAFVDAAEHGRGLRALTLRTERLAAAVEELRGRGAAYDVREPLMLGARKLADGARHAQPDPTVVEPELIEYLDAPSVRYARFAAAGLTSHAFPLKRLDHLAAVAPNLEAQSAYWTDVLGVPLFGEIRTPVMIIRQFKIGDAILELLGPATPESPLAQRPPGLVSMIACEVPDLAEAVAMARAAGFTPSEPGSGALPGTRTATIPGAELSGLALQLLQYV